MRGGCKRDSCEPAPQVVDAVLLASAIAIAWTIDLSPFQTPLADGLKLQTIAVVCAREALR